ncbi:hypothetical protein K504DRAFT_148179 [Pleomassaria siparia CBS 279.74]|uniref:Uncharacterized protein n=1 Tax=Pleomassaria siparia CBS 279.74 TaxID=1314801 RepID=A0A6G1KMZ5_9PLEO|nr:hypothetical protein K504DRAFT_148179 [Pleomassaria siparia CBS 279.74]
MPPRSVLLNVFTTAKGLGDQAREELREQVYGEEENARLNAAGNKDVKIEAREKRMHVKHDSTQASPNDAIAIATTYNSFATTKRSTSSDHVSTFTATSAPTILAVSSQPATTTGSPEAADVIPNSKLPRTGTCILPIFISLFWVYLAKSSSLTSHQSPYM